MRAHGINNASLLLILPWTARLPGRERPPEAVAASRAAEAEAVCVWTHTHRRSADAECRQQAGSSRLRPVQSIISCLEHPRPTCPPPCAFLARSSAPPGFDRRGEEVRRIFSARR